MGYFFFKSCVEEITQKDRWVEIKGKTIKALEIRQWCTNTAFLTTSCWDSRRCDIILSKTCDLISDYSNNTSTVTPPPTKGILWDIDYSLSGISYTYKSYFCNKQYDPKTSWYLHLRANGHRSAIETKYPYSFFSYSSHPDYYRSSLDEYTLLPIEQTSMSGSDRQRRDRAVS